jgi:hypothetical protein
MTDTIQIHGHDLTPECISSDLRRISIKLFQTYTVAGERLDKVVATEAPERPASGRDRRHKLHAARKSSAAMGFRMFNKDHPAMSGAAVLYGGASRRRRCDGRVFK